MHELRRTIGLDEGTCAGHQGLDVVQDEVAATNRFPCQLGAHSEVVGHGAAHPSRVDDLGCKIQL